MEEFWEGKSMWPYKWLQTRLTPGNTDKSFLAPTLGHSVSSAQFFFSRNDLGRQERRGRRPGPEGGVVGQWRGVCSFFTVVLFDLDIFDFFFLVSYRYGWKR